MRVLIHGLALAVLGTTPVFAQMMAPAEEQKTTPMAEPQEEQPKMAPAHKVTAPIKLPVSKIAPNVPLSPRERAVQMLNRFTYGARPGDVEQVMAMGADNWFAQQLNPESIADPVVTKRLQEFPTVSMSAAQILSLFPTGDMTRAVMAGRQPYPGDPLAASVYEAMVYKIEEGDAARKLHDKLMMYDKAPTEEVLAAREKLRAAPAPQAGEPGRPELTAGARVAGALFALPKGQRMAAFEAMPATDRIAFANTAPTEQKSALLADLSARDREAIYAIQGGAAVSTQRIYDELAQAKMVRSVLSERQLQEVMTDFWFNHFNIFQPKDSDQWYTTAYEREVIRPNALGKFRDLLLATATSPAMMIYLDNYLSIGPESAANGVNPANPNAKKGGRGLNENYGREVMELHTVGVNGGYSQADVTHLSAILTGWTVDRPNEAGSFVFNAKMHEPGTKEWFGYTIDEQGKVLAGPAGKPLPAIAFPANVPDGMKQGWAALAILANSPKTAHFISYKLAQRFVADDPPEGLVERMAATYMASDGDIKAVLKTMVASPEFNSHKYFRNKVKTPVEFLASAFRTTATDPQNAGALVGLLGRELGEPIYKALPPTGYYITADQWMNTQSLLVRLNFADQLTHNRFANQKFDAPKVLALSLMSDPDAGARASAEPPGAKPRAMPVSAKVTGPAELAGADIALRVLEASLIGGEISPNTDAFIHSQMVGQPAGTSAADTLNLLTALLLGSPEFQLR